MLYFIYVQNAQFLLQCLTRISASSIPCHNSRHGRSQRRM